MITASAQKRRSCCDDGPYPSEEGQLKMNTVFCEYVTRTAFNLSLSRDQIVALGALYGIVKLTHKKRHDAGIRPQFPSPWVPVDMRSFCRSDALWILARKGLVAYSGHRCGNKKDEWALTAAGKDLIPVLVHAGFLKNEMGEFLRDHSDVPDAA